MQKIENVPQMIEKNPSPSKKRMMVPESEPQSTNKVVITEDGDGVPVKTPPRR